MTFRIGLALLFFLVQYKSPALANSVADPERVLSTAIEKTIPSATLISANEIDAKSCGPISSNPGLVRADLNGDGHVDFAVLLKIRETGKVVAWQGASLKQAEFAIAIFFGSATGALDGKVLWRFTNYIPTGTYVELVAAGRVRNRETQEDVLLRNPGVAVVSCERSVTVYYVDGNEVKSIPVVD